MVFEFLHLFLEVLWRDFGVGPPHFINKPMPAEDKDLGRLIDNRLSYFRSCGRSDRRRSTASRAGSGFSGGKRLANDKCENEPKNNESSEHKIEVNAFNSGRTKNKQFL